MRLKKDIIDRICDPQDRKAANVLAIVLILFETIFSLWIIRTVQYTEIDWIAYMQEVDGFIQGERNYENLKGDTGPLVYPAGFVYIYTFLKKVSQGIPQVAQSIFALLYLATQALVMRLYIDSKIMPPWSLSLLCLSRRLHSIYMLRLFNDCWAMFIAYLAVFLLQKKRWTLSVFLFSLAVSVKMNVLLFAPGVVAVFIKEANVSQLFTSVLTGILLQVVLGWPFLLAYPRQYVGNAFEFARVFTYKWTVNWQFLPESIFVSKQFAILLLGMHIALLSIFASKFWLKQEGGVQGSLHAFLARKAPHRHRRGTESESWVPLVIVFSANFIGITCARSLHYQFYSWYFHTLPFLLRCTGYPWWALGTLLVAIEVGYFIPLAVIAVIAYMSYTRNH